MCSPCRPKPCVILILLSRFPILKSGYSRDRSRKEEVMKGGPVRAGIIGSQFQADCHATAMGMIEEDMSMVAVASPTAAHAQAFADRHKVARVYNDYREL